MINPALLTFLNELEQNNNKAWFDEHRAEYKALRAEFTDFLRGIAGRIAYFDPAIQLRLDDPKLIKVFRINRDIRFSKDKTPYKTNMAGTIGEVPGEIRPLYYLNIQEGQSMAGGGIYMPSSSALNAIREKVDVDYASLEEIINEQSFRETFPDGLTQYGALKTAPRGYSIDHPAIELLRLKSFAATRTFSDEEISQEGFDDEVVDTFEALSPLNDYLALDYS